VFAVNLAKDARSSIGCRTLLHNFPPV